MRARAGALGALRGFEPVQPIAGACGSALTRFETLDRAEAAKPALSRELAASHFSNSSEAGRTPNIGYTLAVSALRFVRSGCSLSSAAFWSMSFSSLHTLSVVFGIVLAASAVVVGCSGAEFSAAADGAVGGDAATAGDSSGGASNGGSANAHAGHGGRGSAGAATGGNGAAGLSVVQGGSSASGEAGAAGERALGGSGGLGATGGVSAAGGVGASGGSTVASGGLAASGGSSGAGQAGDGAGGACDPVPWFPDGDEDGFGRSSGQVVACEPPTNGVWVLVGGDCNDDNKVVFPHKAGFAADGYTSSGNAVSFDYDCSGMEEVDPSSKGAAPACSLLSCTGSGFQPTNRSGPGVNPLCGSKSLVTCTSGSLSCSGVVTQVSEGVRCH